MQQGLATGAFAEKVVVDQSQIQTIPEDISMASASLLACGVITGMGAVTNTAKVSTGSTVVVIGAGGVGLNAIQGAAIAGASKIIAIDVSEEKLDAAKEFGATDGILTSEEKPYRIVKKMTGGRGVDYVFVTVGSIPAYESASRFLSVGGSVVMVGMPPSGAKVAIEPVILATTSQSLLGSYMGSSVLKKDIPVLIDLYKQGRLKLDELVTRKYSLNEINEAVNDVKLGNTRRNVIVFD
jgi:Zn-dependent alcohol dehydrogenase